MKNAVMYVNQFFGQIGGEEKAGIPPLIRDGAVGPAAAMNELLTDAVIIKTVICGDNYMSSNTDEAVEAIIRMLTGLKFDLLIAGPAFQAGRYGVACGTICKAVQERFQVAAVTSMHEENPGVEMFKKDIYIMKGSRSSAKMRKDLLQMAGPSNKLLDGSNISGAVEEGFYSRGIRHQAVSLQSPPASLRALAMLEKKLGGQEYQTELPMPKMDRVPIAPAIKRLSKATIALITTGGIVPVDNPDRIQSASATRWGRYDITGTYNLAEGVYKTIHAGFDPSAANGDPDVITPVDALRQYEKEGRFKRLHNFLYSTVGTGTTQAEAKRMAGEMIPFLKEDCVHGVILVST